MVVPQTDSDERFQCLWRLWSFLDVSPRQRHRLAAHDAPEELVPHFRASHEAELLVCDPSAEVALQDPQGFDGRTIAIAYRPQTRSPTSRLEAAVIVVAQVFRA